MRITLINGNPDPANSTFEAYVQHLGSTLKLKGIETQTIDLKKAHILSCTGCWGCWVKTPGECLFEDDTRTIRDRVINSDWVLFLSPLIMGFTSALAKKVQDKFIPLVHPYIELVNNECHHEKRYDRYPTIGLIYSKEKDTDDEDLKIVSDIYTRFALNFKTEFKLFHSIDEPIETVASEISTY